MYPPARENRTLVFLLETTHSASRIPPKGHIIVILSCGCKEERYNFSELFTAQRASFAPMGTELKTSAQNMDEQTQMRKERQKKIDEVRAALGPVPEKLSWYCSDASISRYLRARNWNVKKATRMLKETLKWRLELKPDEIRWEDIAGEAGAGKVYKSNFVDKKGRTVLVMRPSCQNSSSAAGQIKYFVYCMENAIFNLPPNQEQTVWLVDFWNFNLSNISVKLTKDTAHVLQNHYPERLGVAIMYNPPRIFEQFFAVVKPFLEPKTRKKVKFVYKDDPSTKKIMEELFDMDQLESAFGGNNTEGFDIEKYALKMKEDDEKRRLFWEKGEGNYALAALSCNGVIDASSPSDDECPSEEEEEKKDNREISSSAEGSSASLPEVNLPVAAMKLNDSGNAKA